MNSPKFPLHRRDLLKLMACAAPAFSMRRLLAQAASPQLPIAPGPFRGTRASLTSYEIPAWFGKAKFGIWAHWGPQSAIGDGDWYARNMYVQGTDQYFYHTETFGHPSRIGYKDLIPLYTASRWDPDALIDLYVKAGAKYFFSMGVHHDNYDLWNSRFQPHWNAVATGPKRDVVGAWRIAARKRGLRFGVSEHLSNSYDWFAPAHESDTTGEYAGIPYDGANPAYASLYHDLSQLTPAEIRALEPMGRIAPERWKLEYFNRVKDLIDQHEPDLLYTDGAIPFEEYGLSLVAELYNLSYAKHGFVDAVYLSKRPEDSAHGTCVLDWERGVPQNTLPHPWQTDTCIGNWHYQRGIRYKTGKEVVDLFVDVVSKNGNLLLNFPLPASGELDIEERQTLDDFTRWMSINNEGIYETTPWRVYGEGPSTKLILGSGFNESKRKPLTVEDIRFTQKPGVLFAFVQGWPATGRELTLTSLGTTLSPAAPKVTHVALLGSEGRVNFTQTTSGLVVTLPEHKPAASDIGICLKLDVGSLQGLA